jgi:hypothetical protein
VNGQSCEVKEAVELHIKLLNFSWDQEFKILNCGPFPVILGLDYLTLACMSIESGAREYYFEFALESSQV